MKTALTILAFIIGVLALAGLAGLNAHLSNKAMGKTVAVSK